MKKIFTILFFGLLCNLSFSQYLKGRVVDASNQPLPSTSVYYDGTTLATLTNENGEFVLAYNSKLNRPLVISYIGYQTVYIQQYSPDQPLIILMEVLENKLREVVIRKDRFSRKEKMKIFKERFLGITDFGMKTVIQNEKDIEFDYDEETFTLKAYSEKPLIIINPSLGYKITYELVDFETKFSCLSINSHAISQSYYAGLSQYEETKNSSKIEKNREKAYKGSVVNFFRNLINGVWGKNEFQLFAKGFLTNPADHFTLTFENDKYRVAVKNQKLNSNYIASFGLLNDGEKSQVMFATETIYIDQFGNNISLRDVTFSGAISTKSVGDLLPLKYGM
jgi:hypothetical protein